MKEWCMLHPILTFVIIVLVLECITNVSRHIFTDKSVCPYAKETDKINLKKDEEE